MNLYALKGSYIQNILAIYIVWYNVIMYMCALSFIKVLGFGLRFKFKFRDEKLSYYIQKNKKMWYNVLKWRRFERNGNSLHLRTLSYISHKFWSIYLCTQDFLRIIVLLRIQTNCATIFRFKFYPIWFLSLCSKKPLLQIMLKHRSKDCIWFGLNLLQIVHGDSKNVN